MYIYIYMCIDSSPSTIRFQTEDLDPRADRLAAGGRAESSAGAASVLEHSVA